MKEWNRKTKKRTILALWAVICCLALSGAGGISLNAKAEDGERVIPCGMPIGIYMQTDGIMVIGTSTVISQTGMEEEPAKDIIRAGDYILAYNGTAINEKEELLQMVENGGGADAVLTIRRDGETMNIRVKPVNTSPGEYQLGIWVRDDTQGIGTMTYIDENRNFGALGHGISDIDTGKLVAISDGELYQTQIRSIIKGEAGNPGSLAGVICYGKGAECGDISSNTQCGIFGTVTEAFLTSVDQEWVEVAAKEEVRTGEAVIRTTLDGVQNDYAISILEVNPSGSGGNKEIVLQVTDPQLLEKTGGIVQGMSGSPILQDGKLIGAVTHVLVQDSTKGYGIFIEDMMD